MVKQIMNYFNQKSINEDKQQIEIYDGSLTNNKSAADWLEECENHAIIFQWNEENFIDIFGSRLQKCALDWHAERLESHPNDSYLSWREAFKSKFESSIHLQKKRERFYDELQQNPDEPIGHFIDEIERSFKSLYGAFNRNDVNLLRDDTLTRVLMNGVLPSIKKIMIESNYFNNNDRTDWKGITEAAFKAEKLIVIRRMAQHDSGVINERFIGLKQESNQKIKHFIDRIEGIFESCGYGPIPQKDESYDSTHGLRIEDDVLIEALMRGVLPAIKENMLKSFLLLNYDWHTFTNAAIVAETNILFQQQFCHNKNNGH